jgi:hypothetical protein
VPVAVLGIKFLHHPHERMIRAIGRGVGFSSFVMVRGKLEKGSALPVFSQDSVTFGVESAAAKVGGHLTIGKALTSEFNRTSR